MERFGSYTVIVVCFEEPSYNDGRRVGGGHVLSNLEYLTLIYIYCQSVEPSAMYRDVGCGRRKRGVEVDDDVKVGRC